MAVTVTSTPVIGGGFGNRKIIVFTFSGTYASGGIPLADLGFTPDEFSVIIVGGGACAVVDTSNSKLKLGTLGTASSSTTLTEFASSTDLVANGVMGGIAIV